MVRYYYAWTPLFIVGTIVLLSLPWLGLIALVSVSLVLIAALAALANAIAWAFRVLSGAITQTWHGRSGSTQALTPARSPASSDDRPTQLVPAGATLLIAREPSERDEW